jgi:hypothetical protein
VIAELQKEKQTTEPAVMRLHASPSAATMFDYWDSKRNGRLMPARADIDPIEMKPWLAGIQLVDVFDNPRRFVYRLAGEVEVLIRGFNHTGHSVEEAFFGVSREEVMRNYNLVVDERTMLFDWARYRTRLDYLVSQETIFLPLSADGQNVNMVLTYTVVQGL